MTGFDETVPPDDDPDLDATSAEEARDNTLPSDDEQVDEPQPSDDG